MLVNPTRRVRGSHHRELAIAGGAMAVIAALIVVGGGATRPAAPAPPPAVAAAAPAAGAPSPVAARRPTPGLRLRTGGPSAGAPGALALRQQADDFVEQQATAVAEHMRREGISLDETRELTYFAILATAAQDWDRIEALTGAALTKDARRQTWEAMMARSQEMRRELQEQVAAGADEETRWATITRIEDGFLDDYYRLTGMSPALLDQLLAAAVRDERSSATIASLAPDAPPPHAGGGGQFVRRDPAHPERPPVPVTDDAPDAP